MSTQIRRRSALQWCVLARWSVGIALAQCCELTGVVAAPAWFSSATRPGCSGARCDNHNGTRCDWHRLFRAGAVHSGRHPPVTARQHGRWMPRRQGSAASLRIIRGVPLRLRPPVRLKGRAAPDSSARQSQRDELFVHRHGVNSFPGTGCLRSPCVPSLVLSFRTPKPSFSPCGRRGWMFWQAPACHLPFQASGRPNSPFSPCGRRGQGG